MDDGIRVLVLKNAVKYGGKANPKAVLGAVLKEFPEKRKKIDDLRKLLEAECKEINKLSAEEQEALLKKLDPSALEKKEKKERDLPVITSMKQGKVHTRIPPEPSKYIHIGHALSFLLNFLYAQRYKGSCLLRFEDANPEKVTKEYVDAMREDLAYLEIKPDKELFVSDSMDQFYTRAEELITKGNAYMCFCEQEKLQKLRNKMQACDCRENDAKENMKLWKEFLGLKFAVGTALLRLRGDLKSKNGVMRDPALFRRIDVAHFKHKKKYSIWPMYDFYNAIMDATLGISHILRSNEFMQRGELQDYIKQLLQLPTQEIVEYGRFNVLGAISKGREIRELIEKDAVTGWDDPRLTTIKAFRRRGIIPETYRELVKEVGLSSTPTNISYDTVASINRRLLDPVAKRFFLLTDSVPVVIENTPLKKVELNLHPDAHKGGRKFEISEKFLLSKKDLSQLEEGKIHRLMDCINFEKKGKKFVFHSEEYSEFKDTKNKGRIMHFLPDNGKNVPVSVMMDDASVVEGVAEGTLSTFAVDDVVQAERFGFVRVDKKGKQVDLWFSHK